MIRSSELLRSYLHGILRLTDAASASLYVPPSLTGASAILLHDGDARPVPELEGLTPAQELHDKSDQAIETSAPLELGFAREVPSRSAECVLVRVPARDILRATDEASPKRRKGDRRSGAPESVPIVWLGLRMKNAVLEPSSDSAVHHPPRATRLESTWAWLLAFGGALAKYAHQVSDVLDDPVSGLPGRVEFQASLERAVENARETGRPMTLLLMNPDDFPAVNDRFGREAGDRAVREIASRFRACHRASDCVAKYGGVIFASLLIDTDGVAGETVARKLLGALTGPFLEGQYPSSFSIGLAELRPDDDTIEDDLDLVRRADRALNAAKRAGGDRFVLWQPGSPTEETGNLDRLSGIFTGNMAKDYRNMALLSDAMGAIASCSDFDALAAGVVERLYDTLKPERVGILSWSDERGLQCIKGLTRSLARTERPINDGLELREEQRGLLERARARGGAVWHRWLESTPDGSIEILACAAPLVVNTGPLRQGFGGQGTVGCLYLEARSDSAVFDSGDHVFLEALCAQLAVALDRARLSERERQRQEQEGRRLRAELAELRHALQQAKLVYRSEPMADLLDVARRVAPTEATVLITGESGTGKELIARTIHELSPRRKKPLVVVDCSAIPATLIESELFGYERGAYTGAHHRKPGRLVDANGGTVLLDEVGELPVEVQSKLLRFVQEKEVIPVGGTETRVVDVRLLAATNRDLAAEVAAGRFRSDLYYRLNVVRLRVPALRERPDDILHLANHFAQKYALLYQKRMERLTPEAEAALVRHPWPGNVRELQNRILQAVILCDDEVLGAAELGISELSPAKSAGGGPHEDAVAPASLRPGEAAAIRGTSRSAAPSQEKLWDELKRALRKQVDSALAGGSRFPPPLGRWLSAALVLEASALAGGVSTRATSILGIPETTFRRRLEKAKSLTAAGFSPRLPSWNEVLELLRVLVHGAGLEGSVKEDLLERAERILIEEIVAGVHGDDRFGAALLGVTATTFHRRASLVECPLTRLR